MSKMDSNNQNTFTRRMLQRAASVRRNREGSLRCNLDDSKRRLSILQAIGDNPARIADVADCRINNSTGLTPISANKIFAGDKEGSLKRRNVTISDNWNSQPSGLVTSICPKSQSDSTHLTRETESNLDCENPQPNLQTSTSRRINCERDSIIDRKNSVQKGKKYFNDKNDNLEINQSNFIDEIMGLDKSKKADYSKSKNSLNLTETFDSASLNLTAGETTRDSMNSSSYTKGFELGNVRWRGPLYRASIRPKKKKDLNLLDREFEITGKNEHFSKFYQTEEPKLVTAIHKEISPPKKMIVELKTVDKSMKPEVISTEVKNSGNNNSKSIIRPEKLSLCPNTIKVNKPRQEVNLKIDPIPETSEIPITPLGAEIRKLNEDIERLNFSPSFYTPENPIDLSPPDRIYPNLSKIHFTPTGYTPKKLYESPCSPEDNSESSYSTKPIINAENNGWNFEKNSTSKSNYAQKHFEGENHRFNVSKSTITSTNETNATPNSNGLIGEIESDKFVQEASKSEKNDKFKPNMESTRKSSLTDLSKNNTGSPCPRESTVSTVTIPPDTPEGMEKAGTSCSPDEKNLTLNSTVPYNVDDFLADALGDELYNTTMTFPPSESHEKSISQFNASELISEERTPLQKKNKKILKKVSTTDTPAQHSGTFNRTMTIYRSFTQRIKNKLRPGIKAVSKAPTNETTMTVETGLEDEKIQSLLQEANIQQTMMYQANKALNFCRSMKEFASSTELVESERSLLVAGLRRAAALDEIKKLDCELNNNENDLESCERGEVTIKDFSLPLKEDILKYEAQAGDFVQWFVITVSHGATVWATRAVSCPIQSPRIIFNGGFLIPNLSPNFKISVKIYSLKMRRATYNYDDKYHLNQAEKQSRCPSPKKLILRKCEKSLSPKEVHRIEFSAVRNTSFVLSGTLDLYLHDLSLTAPWPLTSLLPDSVLRGTIDLSLSCKLHLSVSHAGFLTHGDEAGGLATWNRRWCVLQGQTLRFWNYPCDQEDKMPLAVIDLTNCISQEITNIDRSLCAKPRTLLIETIRRRSIMDRNSMVLECRLSCTIVRNLLCCDTAGEFSQWKSKLNHVVSALRDWNVTDRSSDHVQVSDL